ncbi:MAG: DnaD domain protein [Lachnospiraceae bacterium]|nr:DnaD domain protein [Lachnospiraceae bacterium]
MRHIALYNRNRSGFTRISNNFIDCFLADANEVQIKIYLYLLRCSNGELPIDVDSIAEHFNYSERDILRALLYWDKSGLLSLDFDDEQNVKGICLNDVAMRPSSHPAPAQPSPVPEEAAHKAALEPQKTAQIEARPFYSMEQLNEFKENEALSELFFMAEQYLGRTINNSDLSAILYMYDHLHFSIELIEFLIEYCVDTGHSNIRYIEATAHKWKDLGIKDVEAARSEVSTYGKDYYTVLRAFGLGGRQPVKSDIDAIRRWKNEYGFDMDVIVEAVNRTMRSIARPSFSYADSILRSWKEHNVRKKSDIERLDMDFSQEKNATAKKKLPPVPANDKFRNFNERNYDYDELLKRFAKN